jgi:aminobenzoyl-glutamate transport protein
LEVTANFYFGIVSSIVLAIVAVVVTQRIVEPRLGKYDPTNEDKEAAKGMYEKGYVY